ncbi:MAG: ATP-binding protein [Desulfurivibrio sp.]|nr:ATP-binding protein [Desulfurivibrio sp.]
MEFTPDTAREKEVAAAVDQPPGKMAARPAKGPRLPPEINRLVGRAMHRYQMLADGDRVMVAVSGGIDSLVLGRLLALWRDKAPIDYELLAVHLDMGFAGYLPPPEWGNDPRDTSSAPLPTTATAVAAQLQKIGLPYYMEETTYGPEALAAEGGKNGCYHCASRRRARLFELAREKGCNKLAMGHHREDIIETFFLNLLYGGNLSTMVPNQHLFEGRLQLIRPLALLDKTMVRQLGELFQVEAVSNPCPLTNRSRRHRIRQLLHTITGDDPRLEANIFAALGNVRPDYLL